MKKTRSGALLTAAALSLVLVLGLSACGGESSTPATPEEVLAKAQEAMDSVTSMGYDMSMTMSMGVEGMDQSMEISTTTSAEAILSPMTMKVDMAVDMGELGSNTNLTMYIKEENGKYQIATGVPASDGSITWQTSETSSMDDLASLDGKTSMDLYLTSASSFTEGVTETVGDVEATRYDGVISGAKMEEVLQTSGVLSQLDKMGLGNVSSMFTELGDLPVSIWIAKETYYPVKYEMDMAQMMQSIMEKALSEQAGVDVGLSVSKMDVSMVMRDFNAIENIEIPEEAFA